MNRHAYSLFMFFQAALLSIAGLGSLVFGWDTVNHAFMMMEAGAVSFFIGCPVMLACEALQAK